MNTASIEVGSAVEVAPAPSALPERLVDEAQRASVAVAQGVVGYAAIIVLNASTGILTARALLPAGRGNLAAMTLWPLFLAYPLRSACRALSSISSGNLKKKFALILPG